jgi:hypothetical protein
MIIQNGLGFGKLLVQAAGGFVPQQKVLVDEVHVAPKITPKPNNPQVVPLCPAQNNRRGLSQA